MGGHTGLRVGMRVGLVSGVGECVRLLKHIFGCAAAGHPGRLLFTISFVFYSAVVSLHLETYSAIKGRIMNTTFSMFSVGTKSACIVKLHGSGMRR